VKKSAGRAEALRMKTPFIRPCTIHAKTPKGKKKEKRKSQLKQKVDNL